MSGPRGATPRRSSHALRSGVKERNAPTTHHSHAVNHACDGFFESRGLKSRQWQTREQREVDNAGR